MNSLITFSHHLGSLNQSVAILTNSLTDLEKKVSQLQVQPQTNVSVPVIDEEKIRAMIHEAVDKKLSEILSSVPPPAHEVTPAPIPDVAIFEAHVADEEIIQQDDDIIIMDENKKTQSKKTRAKTKKT